MLVALVLFLTFGSLLAPLVTLLAAGVAYIIGSRLVALAATGLGLVPPSEIDPLVVVLLLGIVADYAIFYLSGARDRLAQLRRRGEAARDTTAELTPIILVAALMVAAGTAALLAATQQTFRSFGPSLAISVLAGLVVSVTFVPAVLADVRPRPLLAARARGPRPAGARRSREPALSHALTPRAPRHPPVGRAGDRARLRRRAAARGLGAAQGEPGPRLHQRAAVLQRRPSRRRRRQSTGFANRHPLPHRGTRPGERRGRPGPAARRPPGCR